MSIVTFSLVSSGSSGSVSKTHSCLATPTLGTSRALDWDDGISHKLHQIVYLFYLCLSELLRIIQITLLVLV